MGIAPTEHLLWFDENRKWFEAIPLASYDVAVPTCPGWAVVDVMTHLAFGLGLAYPVALRTGPNATDGEALSDVEWPSSIPAGSDAKEAFAVHMSDCSEAFAAVDPDALCWTYAGPGKARFWLRRAAIETTLHRMDVAEALEIDDVHIRHDRVVDALEETIEFALPYGTAIVGVPAAAVTISVEGHADEFQLGHGLPNADISGDGQAVLSALWGRHRDGVEISGDHADADRWMTVIETAFSGR